MSELLGVREIGLFAWLSIIVIWQKKLTEKSDLQHRLETQVELVRNFWRNQIVEGDSRPGNLLRVALIRK